ncbi:hypothetical protein ACS0TY_025829 [Phlomoides rotata]
MADKVESVMGPITSLEGMALMAAHVVEAVVFFALDESTFSMGLNLKVDVLEIWLEILTQSTILKIKTKSTQRLYEDCRRLFLVDKV